MATVDPKPRVSCLMVTADRARLCRRAVRCYQKQTYPNKELVVVDDGAEDLGPVLAALPADEVIYIKLEPHPEQVLGDLRNRALEAASGQFLTQWDDDDWYHPERIERQVDVLQQGHDACCLSASLMHLDDEVFFDHPYLGLLPDGIPGTIMHRRDPMIRYPAQRRAEDTVYLQQWMQKQYLQLPRSEARLFIRCFHGDNTWDRKHFLTRMRNTLPDLLAYGWYRYVKGDLFAHPRFQLTEAQWEAFEAYLEDSYALDVLHLPHPHADAARGDARML